MTTTRASLDANKTGRSLEIIATLAMLFSTLAIIGPIVGYSGLGLITSGIGDNSLLSIPVEVNFPVDFGGRLSWEETTNGTVDAATGQSPMEFSGPVEAQLSFWSPTGTQRQVFVIRQIFGPALVLAGAWQVFQIVRSARSGDPFSKANERRLRKLAFLVGVGGSINIWFGAVAEAWLVQRSAAASFVDPSFEFSFLPIIIGITIAVLASVWGTGVQLREDVDGMV